MFHLKEPAKLKTPAQEEQCSPDESPYRNTTASTVTPSPANISPPTRQPKIRGSLRGTDSEIVWMFRQQLRNLLPARTIPKEINWNKGPRPSLTKSSVSSSEKNTTSTSNSNLPTLHQYPKLLLWKLLYQPNQWMRIDPRKRTTIYTGYTMLWHILTQVRGFAVGASLCRMHLWGPAGELIKRTASFFPRMPSATECAAPRSTGRC